MTPKLMHTTDYSLFELHEFNRTLHDDNRLEESMREHGFTPSSAIQVIKNGNGKYKIVRGHHRFETAKRLGLPVYFIIDDSNTDIFSLETKKQRWNLMDFTEARARSGDENCEKVLWYKAKYKIPLAMSVGLMSGNTSTQGSKSECIERGTYKVANDLSHPIAVGNIVHICLENKIPFANSAAFVHAISSCLRIPEFDSNLFIHKVRLYSANLRKRATWLEYLEEIEAFYNYGLKKSTIPIAFRAKEVMRERNPIGKKKSN